MPFARTPTSQGDLFLVQSHRRWWRAVDLDFPDRGLFDGGLPIGLQIRLGLIAPGRPNVRMRAFLVLVLGWVPLALITLLQGVFLQGASFASFAVDYGTHARSLIAAPLLVLAEGICFPRLGGIVKHFRDGGLVHAADVSRFREAERSTRALRDSLRLEFAVLGFAVALVAALRWSVPLQAYQAWHRMGAGAAAAYSPAGWWNVLVSVPLLITLLLGWLWRLGLWTRFLWLMSRLRLRLIAAHPDGAGGLKFIGLSVQTFIVLAFACGVIVAGTIVNNIAHNGASLLEYRYVVAGFVVLMVVLFAGPLAVFSLKLLEARRRGILEYGALARSVGAQMERKWFRRHENAGDDALAAPDFSATTDLYSIAANAYAMTVFPLAWISLALLVAGALLPFLPALLLSVSPEVLFSKLTGLFL